MKAMNVLYLMITFNIVSIIFQTMGIWTGSFAIQNIGSFFVSGTLAVTLTAGTTIIAGYVLGPEYTSAVMFYGLFSGLWNVNTLMLNSWGNFVGFGWMITAILFGLGQLFAIVGANQVMSGGWQSHV